MAYSYESTFFYSTINKTYFYNGTCNGWYETLLEDIPELYEKDYLEIAKNGVSVFYRPDCYLFGYANEFYYYDAFCRYKLDYIFYDCTKSYSDLAKDGNRFYL